MPPHVMNGFWLCRSIKKPKRIETNNLIHFQPQKQPCVCVYAQQ